MRTALAEELCGLRRDGLRESFSEVGQHPLCEVVRRIVSARPCGTDFSAQVVQFRVPEGIFLFGILRDEFADDPHRLVRRLKRTELRILIWMEGNDVGVLESAGLETGFVESRHARAEIAGRAESDDTVCRVGLFQRFVCSLEIRNVVGRFRPEPEMRFIHDFIVGNAFSGVLRIGGDKAFPEFNRRFEESCSGEILLTSSEFLFAFGDQPVGESFRPGPFDVAGNPEI